MRYIEKNENITREFFVEIDDKELEKIINELDEKYRRSTKVDISVTASNEEEAEEKINKIKKDDIIILKKNELPNYNKGSFQGMKTQYLYDCAYFYKKKSYLEHLLDVLLKSYRSNVDYSSHINDIFDDLINYENNEELKTYEEKMAENGITKDLFLEYEYNKDFDFKKLKDLYYKALNCFKLICISETIHYDNTDGKAKVYKFGTR